MWCLPLLWPAHGHAVLTVVEQHVAALQVLKFHMM